VAFNAAEPPSLFLNQAQNANHSVLFRLVGSKSNRSGIGARVIVSTPSMTQIDEVRGGGNYNSTNDSRLHFGLGTDPIINKLEVRWPSGAIQQFSNLQAASIYELDEDSGIHKVSALPSISPAE
jgi:hypothetical protein